MTRLPRGKGEITTTDNLSSRIEELQIQQLLRNRVLNVVKPNNARMSHSGLKEHLYTKVSWLILTLKLFTPLRAIIILYMLHT